MAGNQKKKASNKSNSKKKNTNVVKKATNSKAVPKKKDNIIKEENTIGIQNQEIIKVSESIEKIEKVKKVDDNLAVEFESLKKMYSNKKREYKKKYKALSKPYRYLVAVFFICSLILISEGVIIAAGQRISNDGTVFHDSYSAVAVDDGNVVVVGNSDFKYSKLNEYTKGNARGKLIKYNNSGEIVFEKVYEKGLATSFNSIITVSDGYVVAGTGIFSEEEKKNEIKEAFILKYDKNGDLVWEKFYQVLTNTSFNRVKEVPDGYIVVGQSIYANMEVGNQENGGGIIVKYDRDGNQLWHNHHGGTKSGNFNDFVVVNNEIYVVGKDGADAGNLVKFSSNGEYLWHKNYVYTDSFGFGGIAYLDNNLFVVGSKKILPQGTGDNDDRSTSNTDAVLVKYDLDGNLVMEKTFGGSSYERYNRILLYHGNFYVVGHICSHDAGLKVTGDFSEMTGLVVRYDRNGNILKKETFGGSNNDNITDIATDGISFFAVGYSNSGDGNITVNKSNGKDYFGELLKLNSRFKKMYSK